MHGRDFDFSQYIVHRLARFRKVKEKKKCGVRVSEGRHGPAELAANKVRVGRCLNRVILVSSLSYCRITGFGSFRMVVEF